MSITQNILYQGTLNVNITITFVDEDGVAIDLTAYNTPTYTIKYRKPSGARGSLSASSSGQATGTIAGGIGSVLDELGVWEFQGKIVEGAGDTRTVYSDMLEVYVARNAENIPSGVSLTQPTYRYVAAIVQSGSSNPTVTVGESTFSGTIVWTRSSAGVYIGTLTGVFTSGKTFVRFSAKETASGLPMSTHGEWVSVDTVRLLTFLQDDWTGTVEVYVVS